MTETSERAREEFEQEIERIYDSCDRMGKFLFQLAMHAIARDDRRLAHDLVEINAMPRSEGQTADLDGCEGFGGLHYRVDRLELRLWVAAAGEAYATGQRDILAALDALARRRACH